MNWSISPVFLTQFQNHFNCIADSIEPLRGAVDIFWHDICELGSNFSLGQKQNPELEVLKQKDRTIVYQRDFISIEIGLEYHLYTDPNFPDGFYNFLRYFLPIRLLKTDQLVLHSSVVVDKQDCAYIFLGPSGFGKSTISKLARPWGVLGDDMNILGIEGGEFFVEASHLGQGISDKNLFDRKFKVKEVYWLKKSNRNWISQVFEPTRSFLSLLRSVSGIEWSNLCESDLQKIKDNVFNFSRSIQMKELHFTKECSVNEFIRQSESS